MTLNLNGLRLFEAVARHGNVTRAAASVRVSQPAVSKAVRELERTLGVALLVRGARGVRLTEAGHALAEHAHALFGVARAAEEEVRAFAGLARGTLRVGGSTTIATWLLPPLLAEFARRHPAVDVRLTSANTGAIARQLLGYELDVALVEGPVADPALTARPWREDELVLIAPAGHRLAGMDVAWAEVRREVLLVREPGSGTREVVSGALAALGLTPGRTIELGSSEVLVQGVAAGLGVGFVSAAAAADQLALGRVAAVAVRKLRIRRTLARLEVRGRRSTAAALAFTALLTAPPATPPGARAGRPSRGRSG